MRALDRAKSCRAVSHLLPLALVMVLLASTGQCVTASATVEQPLGVYYGCRRVEAEVLQAVISNGIDPSSPKRHAGATVEVSFSSRLWSVDVGNRTAGATAEGVCLALSEVEPHRPIRGFVRTLRPVKALVRPG